VTANRRELFVKELVRLDAEAIVLERDYRRVPFLILSGFLAIPFYFVWGPPAAMYTILGAPCLMFTALYLVGVRRAENRQAREEIKEQIARMPE
jgi:hypothetical protein